jgi:hypothetical protein
MDEKIFGGGGNIYPKSRSYNIQPLCKVSCLGTAICVFTRISIKMKWPELLTLV